jgi:hypothetical protein
MSSRRIAVCLEVTAKEAFASALDWPAWCRAGRDEGAARQALTSYAERYRPVAEQAGVSFPSAVAFDVVERVPGGPRTAFAAPECRRPFPQMTAEAERAKATPAAAQRLVGPLTAAWATFDEVAPASPPELRKGPRGGGRDRDKLIDHVIGAETAYARELGVKFQVEVAQLSEQISGQRGPRSQRAVESLGPRGNVASRLVDWDDPSGGPMSIRMLYPRSSLSRLREAGYLLGSDRGSPNDGSTLFSKRVMAQIRSPLRVRT